MLRLIYNTSFGYGSLGHRLKALQSILRCLSGNINVLRFDHHALLRDIIVTVELRTI